jgi:putative SOS response-associated peptidase YedK
MCGRVIQSSGLLRLAIVDGLDVTDSPMGNIRPRYNAARSQELLVIRENHKTGERSLDLIKWGADPALVPRSEGRSQAHQRQG